jgi:hypothetical protein
MMNSIDFPIAEEMLLLHAAYIRTFREYSYPEPKPDNTFRTENWLVNFPFNYWHNNSSQPLTTYQTLGLINALYFTFILCEDTVIDDYHLPREEFQLHVLEYCQARVLREIAINHLLNLCGSEVARFILRYEQMYYNALIWEKQLRPEDVSFEAMAGQEHCENLGRKIMPLCLTFAAFCLLTDSQENIPYCEELIVQYHIAHQLFDDISDLLSDLDKPDKSYILRALTHQGVDLSSLTEDNTKDILLKTGVAIQVLDIADKCLQAARQNAERLKFVYMLQQIQRLERKVEAGRTLLRDNP